MPLEQRRSRGRGHARVLDLPPPYRLVTMREVGDAFAHACARAGELGAGALVFVGRFDLAEFAVVLEPEQPLAAARPVFYAGMNALADALAALAPPEKPIALDWPDAIYVDRGLIGGGRLGWPRDCREHDVPDWLVFGAAIRVASMGAEGPRLHPLATALDEEGFGARGAERLVESFARYLMTALDRWQERGLRLIADDYGARLTRRPEMRAEIDARGDLHVRRADGTSRTQGLARALETPSWLDPKTGGPRL